MDFPSSRDTYSSLTINTNHSIVINLIHCQQYNYMGARILPYSAIHLFRVVYKVGGIIKSNGRLKKFIFGSGI